MAGPANAPRRERLTSLTDKNTNTYRAKRNTPPAPARRAQAPVRKCCDNPNVSFEEGSQICYNCGAVLDESDIVAEVTFGENAAGAAIVQGGFVGESQRHANTMGGTMRGLGGIASREQTEYNGRDEIRKLCGALNLPTRIEEQAFGWYKLALNHNFVQGRRIRNVAAVSIYLAARKQPANTLLLMDLSEKVHVNVWALGDTYKQFCRTIMETDPAQISGSTTVQEIEPLMLKFCRKLEFDSDSHRVADDACKLLKRMKRDWMVQGRNPAGLCGACIILAARMNNFRRTVREVVYVVKVADTTINQRLYEYKRTPSSALTVNQFREFGQRLKVKSLPPAVWRREEKERRLEERKRKAQEGGEGEDGSPDVEAQDGAARGEGSSRQVASGTPKRSTRATKKRKTNDGKGKAVASRSDSGSATQANADNAEATETIDVDALEGDAEASLDSAARAFTSDMDVDEEEIVIPKKRGRPPKKREPIIIPQEDLEIEAELEQEINETIRDWESTFKQFEENENHEVLVRAVHTARQLAQKHMPNQGISDDPDLAEDEFEDDPDVATCVLAPHEVRMKERVWITVNEDWLREQQAKMLAKALEEAQGKPKKPKQKRKHHQMGDGSVLEGQPAASAAEAAQKMLNKRAKHFSSHINYERLKELFPGQSSTEDTTPEGSGQGASPGVSGSEQRPTQPPPSIQIANADADAEAENEEEDAEGEYEEEYPEDEEDLEHQYLDDEDEGFNDEEDYGWS